MDAQEEIGELGQVFLRATGAVREARDWLQDLGSGREAALGAPLLALPRVSVDLSFGLRVEKGRRTLLVRRRRAGQLLTHRLRFGVVATPAPPPPPPAGYRRELLHPSFLMTEDEQGRWRARLADDLLSGERRWRFPPREARREKKRFQRKVAREGELVKSSRRMVFFRLTQERVLAVRVAPGRSGRKDGLFVFEPWQAQLPWAIYNFEDDQAGRTHYRPLALLVRSLREWRAAGQPSTKSAASTSAGIGSLDTFQAELEDGLSSALEELARQPDDGPSAGYLDFDRIEALVSFALGEVRGVDLSRAATETDPERDDLPASVVRILFEPAAEPPRVSAELVELEYLLAGSDRQAAVDLAVRAASAGPLRAFRGLIVDRNRQDRAVILRAFRRRREHLLAIWPAAPREERGGGADEDLVFTFPRRWLRQRGRYEIGEVEIVKAPTDSTTRFALANDSGAAADFQYRPFHRFFRAVLAWQRRGEDPA